MGADTNISWTDHTFNPWWGCERVSPACNNCYAEAFAKRTGHAIWGKNSDRRLFGDKHWAEPLKWNDAAQLSGVPAFVFCASMADDFEDRRDLDDQRHRLWQLLQETPHLVWLLLTKRPENVLAMVPPSWADEWPRNAWVGTTVEDQRRADDRIPELLAIPSPVRFLSCEPLLGPVDLGVADHRGHERDQFDSYRFQCLDCSTDDELVEWFVYVDDPALDWVIVGGESGPGHRPMDLDAFESIVNQCEQAGVACWTKQDSGQHPGKQGRIPDRLWRHQRPAPLEVATT